MVGALGGVATGKSSPTFDLGTIGNIISGLVGGGVLGQIVTLALPSVVAAAQSGNLLQKSIRRGETDTAQRSALTFLKLKGSAIWRRLLVIAFEDVGVGSVEALITTVAASSDSNWRKRHGGDLGVAVHLATVMAKAGKDRSADYLCEARDHPGLAGFAHAIATASLESRLSHVVTDRRFRADAAVPRARFGI